MLLNQGVAAEPAQQRADSCIGMDAGQATQKENRLMLEFDLQQPGDYVVQLIHKPDAAGTKLSATVQVDGSAHCDEIIRSYWIEDGIVSTFKTPVTFSNAGLHILAVESDVKPVKVRLIPQVYFKSRFREIFR